MSEKQNHRSIFAAREHRFSFLIVVASFALVNYGFWERWDLPIYDGVYYFLKARNWPVPDFLLDREWSPLYVIFYSFFQWLPESLDPFWAYALHRLVVLGLIAIAFWRICLSLLEWRLATVTAVVLICNGSLLDNFHVVHAAGLAFVLLGMLLITADGQDPYLVPGLSLCGFFVRPEFAAALVVSLLWLIFQLKRGRLPLVRPGWKASLGLLAALVLWSISSPAGRPSRAFEAFSQQSSWALAGETSVVAGFKHRERTAAVYPEADTFWEAIQANPRAFSKTIALNLLNLPATLLRASSHRGAAPWSAPLSLLLIAWAAASMGHLRRSPGEWFWVCTAAFAISGIAGSVLIRPTALYLVPALPLLFLGTACSCAGLLERGGVRPFGKAVSWLGLAVVAGLAVYSMPAPGQPMNRFSRELALHAARGEPVRVLAYSPESYCLHCRHSQLRCSGAGPETLSRYPGMQSLLEKEHISFLVSDTALRRAAIELNHRGLEDFEANPRAYGFELVDTASGGLTAALLGDLPGEKTSRLYRRIEIP